MPAEIKAITEAEYAAILDKEGHEACPGVAIEFDREVRAAGAAGPRLHATLFRPTAGGAAAAPAVLAFHGGGFSNGDPNGVGAIAKAQALALGVVTVSVSYRLGTAEQPTGMGILEDAACAYEWLHAHAAELGIDPQRVAVAGQSAGCLLAGHLAVGSPWVRTARTATLPQPVALYANWGPLDFVARWYDNGENNGAEANIVGPGGLLAHPAAYHQLSALSHVGISGPPASALFVYGRNDTVVHARQGRLGLAAWTAAGSHAEVYILPNIGHQVVGDNRPQRRQILDKSVIFGAWRHCSTL